jgi:tetratricopeptide (TPR) repeat protein
VQALLDATGDEYRLVRTRAAAGLAGYPLDRLTGEVKTRVEKANQEYLAFIMARPDQWTSHYNMGNYHLDRGETTKALSSYQAALKLYPEAIMPRVNASIAYAQMGESDQAERSLEEALKKAPDSAAANFNMGLLEIGKKDWQAAEQHLKAAFESDPQMAQAAYNLCIITAKDRIDEAVSWGRKASDLMPQEPKYAYTLAFYLNQQGERAEAVRILKGLVEKYPQYKDAETLLDELVE